MEIYKLICFSLNIKEGGNPAAVVVGFSGSDGDRLTLARELDLPVTVFMEILPDKSFALRFFYPHAELPMCVHGSLAAAKVIQMLGATFPLKIHTKNQELIINQMAENIFSVRLPSVSLIRSEISLNDIFNMLKIGTDQLDEELPLTVASVGSIKLFLPLRDEKILASLRPNFDLIKAWSEANKINGIYVYARPQHPDYDFVARAFNPITGYNEDRATGVAVGALAGLLQRNIKVLQGLQLKSPCALQAIYGKDGIEVAGMVVFR